MDNRRASVIQPDVVEVVSARMTAMNAVRQRNVRESGYGYVLIPFLSADRR